jgi:hypothetical protein
MSVSEYPSAARPSSVRPLLLRAARYRLRAFGKGDALWVEEIRGGGGRLALPRRQRVIKREQDGRTEQYTTRCECAGSADLAAFAAATTYSRSIFSKAAALPACARVVPILCARQRVLAVAPAASARTQ